MAEKSPVIVFLFRTLVGEFLLLGRRKKENEIWEIDY